jgi:hypothetical protein
LAGSAAAGSEETGSKSLAGWQQVSCGDGSKGPRYYDWALITTTSPDRHLLVRRCLTPDAMGKRELAFFTCRAPACTALAAVTHPQHPGEHYQHWSRWRRHHQAQARQSHYQRRLTNQPLPMRC